MSSILSAVNRNGRATCSCADRCPRSPMLSWYFHAQVVRQLQLDRHDRFAGPERAVTPNALSVSPGRYFSLGRVTESMSASCPRA